jgi:C4-dicarboxylate-specific signal transduction histidine kinase
MAKQSAIRKDSSTGWRHAGLARRIYLAFLLAAVLPTAIAGLIGVSVSLGTLRTQTLMHLQKEVAARAAGVQLFFDQVAAELFFLANMHSIDEFFDTLERGDGPRVAERSAAMERDFVRLAEVHPYIYQIRLLDLQGRERVRVEKREARIETVPAARLQDKSERYYVREAFLRKRGELYVSPLDLNEEFGKVEQPERPVIRVAATIAGADGSTRGLIVFNLHAQVLLEPLQQMVSAHEGEAYLLDRSGHYLVRSQDRSSGATMQPTTALAQQFGPDALASLLGVEPGALRTAQRIIAHAPVQFGAAYGGADRNRWVIALAFPESVLLKSIINLYLLYAVLLAALAVTAIGGYTLSRRLLGPLQDLKREAEVIAAGDFTRRVRITGRDEIAELGLRFNSMADRLATLYRDLDGHRARLADEVASRTRELAAERALLASVFRHAGDAIVALDNSGAVVLANAAARQLFRIDPAQDTAAPDPGGPPWRQLLADVKPGETLRRDVAVGDKVLSLSVDASLDDGQHHSHVIVARDVSEERRLQDERRQLDRQLFQIEKLTTMGELAMGIAHEIGNPLAGMKAVVQALQYEDDLPADMIDPLRRLESEIDRLGGFLRSFHGFAATVALDLRAVPLREVLDDVLFWTGKEARSQRVSIEVDIAAGLPALKADAAQLKQVLLNLVVNALHAMPDGGSLRIAGRALAQGVQIEVRDSGSGIAAELLQRIFDPFFSTRPGGTGLGLAISAKIVRDHGATIHVESSPGAGARFVLVWPSA